MLRLMLGLVLERMVVKLVLRLVLVWLECTWQDRFRHQNADLLSRGSQ